MLVAGTYRFAGSLVKLQRIAKDGEEMLLEENGGNDIYYRQVDSGWEVQYMGSSRWVPMDPMELVSKAA